MSYREFKDQHGVEWKAWDVQPAGVVGWLSFESDAEKRRLLPLPPTVDDASEEQLRGWLAAATPFPKRGSFIE